MTETKIKIIEHEKEIKTEVRKHGVYVAKSRRPNDRLLFYYEGVLRLVINTESIIGNELFIQSTINETLYTNIKKVKNIKIEAELE